MKQVTDRLKCVKCKIPLKLLSVEYSMDGALLIEACNYECNCGRRRIIISTCISNGDFYVHNLGDYLS